MTEEWWERPIIEAAGPEEAVRDALGRWASMAKVTLQYLEWRELEPERPEYDRAQMKDRAEGVLLFVPLAIEAAERGDIWTAIHHAMGAAYTQGSAGNFSEVFRVKRKLSRRGKPHSKSAKTKELHEKIRAMVLEKRRDGKGFLTVTASVGRHFNRHRKTVRRICKDIEWRGK